MNSGDEQRPATETIRVGFVGVGDIGGPMAAHLIEKGLQPALWARRAASLEQFAGKPFRIAADPADLGQQSDVVGVCVFADSDVREVVLGERGILKGMAPGGVIAIHSTVEVETVEAIARSAAEVGVAVLDAPISGGRVGASAGTLAVMVGGAPEAFAKALPMMRAYGRIVERIGPIGSGLKLKLVNNVLGFVNIRMAWLAIETARKLGLDETAVIATLRASSASSFMLDMLADRMMRDPAMAGHAVTMIEKDTRIFQKLCTVAGLERSPLDDAAEEAVRIIGDLSRA